MKSKLLSLICLMSFIVVASVFGQSGQSHDSKVPGALSQYKKGKEAAHNHDYVKAVDEYTHALKRDPNYTDVYNSRGIAYAKLMKFDKAVDDFSKAIEIDPNNAETYHNRGMVLAQMHKYDMAIADFDSAIKKDNRDAFFLSKARTLESAGRTREAVASYRAFINHPDLKLKQFVNFATARIKALSADKSKETLLLKRDDSIPMVFAVYRFEGTAIDAYPFLATPRKIWRVGRTYMRAEEELNMSTGARTLMIVNEPDYWLINRDTFTGQHGVDNGPTYNTIAPVLSKFAAIYSDSLRSFELCREKKFFENRKAQSLSKKTIDGVLCDSYELKFEDITLSLFLRVDNGNPKLVSVARNGETALTVYYDEYQSDMKPDFSLFRPPAGTTITEMQ